MNNQHNCVHHQPNRNSIPSFTNSRTHTLTTIRHNYPTHRVASTPYRNNSTDTTQQPSVPHQSLFNDYTHANDCRQNISTLTIRDTHAHAHAHAHTHIQALIVRITSPSILYTVSVFYNGTPSQSVMCRTLNQSSNPSRIHACMHACIHSFIHSFMDSLIHPLTNSSRYSIDQLVCVFV